MGVKWSTELTGSLHAVGAHSTLGVPCGLLAGWGLRPAPLHHLSQQYTFGSAPHIIVRKLEGVLGYERILCAKNGP